MDTRQPDEATAFHGLNVRNRFDLARPVIRTNSSRDPGGLSAGDLQQLTIAGPQNLGE